MTERVIGILADFTTVEKKDITETSNLVTDLGLSSLDVINLVVEFEDAFDLEIPDEKIRELVCVGDIVDYLKDNC